MDPYKLKYFDRLNIDHQNAFRFIAASAESPKIFKQLIQEIDDYHAASWQDDKAVSPSSYMSYMEIYCEIIHTHYYFYGDTPLSAIPDE